MISVLSYIILLSICFAPKITLISISNSNIGIRIEDLLILAFIILTFLSFVKNNKINKNTSSTSMMGLIKVFVIYFIFCLISSIYGIFMNYVSTTSALFYLFRKVEYFCFIFAGYRFAKKYNESKLMKIFNCSLIFITFVSILQYYGILGSFYKGQLLSNLSQGRISSIFNGAYELSAFLLLIIPFYLNSNLKKNQILLAIIIIFVNILLSESRTSLVIFIILLFLYFYKRNDGVTKKKWDGKIKKKFLLLVVLIPVIMAFLFIGIDRFKSVSLINTYKVIKISWQYKSFDMYLNKGSWYGKSPYTVSQIAEMGYDASLYMRVSHWFQMIDGLKKSPLIGLGLSISTSAADGNYVRILCESGIIGLILWIMILRKTYNIKENDKFSKSINYTLLSIILGAIFIDVFEASKVMMLFWYLVGIAFRRVDYDKERSNS